MAGRARPPICRGRLLACGDPGLAVAHLGGPVRFRPGRGRRPSGGRSAELRVAESTGGPDRAGAARAGHRAVGSGCGAPAEHSGVRRGVLRPAAVRCGAGAGAARAPARGNRTLRRPGRGGGLRDPGSARALRLPGAGRAGGLGRAVAAPRAGGRRSGTARGCCLDRIRARPSAGAPCTGGCSSRQAWPADPAATREVRRAVAGRSLAGRPPHPACGWFRKPSPASDDPVRPASARCRGPAAESSLRLCLSGPRGGADRAGHPGPSPHRAGWPGPGRLRHLPGRAEYQDLLPSAGPAPAVDA